MNLLLLLSALLSALSGLGGSARAPVAVQAVAEVAAIRPVAGAAVRNMATRPLAAAFDIAGSALGPVVKTLPLPHSVPLWTNRRRE